MVLYSPMASGYVARNRSDAARHFDRERFWPRPLEEGTQSAVGLMEVEETYLTLSLDLSEKEDLVRSLVFTEFLLLCLQIPLSQGSLSDQSCHRFFVAVRELPTIDQIMRKHGKVLKVTQASRCWVLLSGRSDSSPGKISLYPKRLVPRASPSQTSNDDAPDPKFGLHTELGWLESDTRRRFQLARAQVLELRDREEII
jgi:hypothetical protein